MKQKNIGKKYYIIFAIFLSSLIFIPITLSKYNQTLSRNITLNIRQPEYEIKFNSNTGTGTMSNQSLTYGTACTLTANTFTRTGYSFNGWNTKANGSGTSYTDEETVQNLSSTDGDIVNLYAQWKAIKYTITYNLNGGTQATNQVTQFTIEDLPVTILNSTRSGYAFYGWYKNSGLTGNKITTIDEIGNVTLYAKFIKYPIINDVSTTTMTQTQAKAYYGKAVSTVNNSSYNPNSSDTRTWRIFYIDTENKYGDGKGTIYLKADEVTSKKARFSSTYGATNAEGYTSKFGAVVVAGVSKTVSNNRYYQITNNNVVNSSGTTINTYLLKLNPTYATGRKKLARTFTEAEKAAAYLCEPDKFAAYKDSNTNYAIGSPTIEMWMDSWNGLYSSNYNLSYRWNTNASATSTAAGQLPGYQVRLNSETWGQAAGNGTMNINNIDTTGMYKTTVGMWNASPSIVFQGGSLQRQSASGFVGNATINMEYTFCPVTCLITNSRVYTTSYNTNSANSLMSVNRSKNTSNINSEDLNTNNNSTYREYLKELYRGCEVAEGMTLDEYIDSILFKNNN